MRWRKKTLEIRVRELNKSLGLSPGTVCLDEARKRDTERKRQKEYSNRRETKLRKLRKKLTYKSENKLKEKKEGKTYETGIASTHHRDCVPPPQHPPKIETIPEGSDTKRLYCD